MNDSELLRNLINALLEVVVGQKNQTDKLSELIKRIDILSSLVVNSQKPKPGGGILNRENWPQTVFGLIVFIIAALVLIFKGGCSPENPKFFYIDDEQIDGGKILDSDFLDTESDSVDSESEFFDSESDSVEWETDTSDIFDDTDTTCPWDCKPIADSAEKTCDSDWDTDFGGPSYVRNWNYKCPINHWCCQPWPNSDGLTEKCDHCGRNCMTPDDVRLDLACDYPMTMCCDGGDNDFAKRNTSHERNIFLDNN